MSRGEGTVGIFFDPAETNRASTLEEVGDALLARLGGPYGSSVTIEVSRTEDGARLALALAIAGCERWAPALASDAAEAVLSLDELPAMRAGRRTFDDVCGEWLARQGSNDAI